MTTFEITINWWAFGVGCLIGFVVGVLLVLAAVIYVEQEAIKTGKGNV